MAASPWAAAGISVLFVGNSYTFGRTDPALAFVSGAVFSNLTGTNSYQVGIINPASTTIPKAEFNSFTPHTRTATWGGVPGIFKQLTVQANLDYDVSLPTRNAASLRGHFLNTANSSWDMRSNISSGKWDKVVLQEQSDEALGPKTVGTSVLGSNYPPVQAYVNLMENWIHKGTALSYTEQAMFNAVYNNTAACVAAGGTTAICNSTTSRIIPAITNASAATQSYLPQTWARPNLINAPGASAVDPKTGNVTYSGAPAASFFSDLESIAAEMSTGMSNVAAFAALDNGGATAHHRHHRHRAGRAGLPDRSPSGFRHAQHVCPGRGHRRPYRPLVQRRHARQQVGFLPQRVDAVRFADGTGSGAVRARRDRGLRPGRFACRCPCAAARGQLRARFHDRGA